MLDGPPKVGELLLKHQLVTHDQLDKALSAQGARGGRLGSVFIELGLAADRIAQVLAAQQGVYAASEQALRAPNPAALGAVSRALCERFEVVPLQLVDGILHLAMRDPRLDIIGDLGQTLGMNIQPYVVAERLIYAYLELHYHIARPARYAMATRQAAVTGPPRAALRPPETPPPRQGPLKPLTTPAPRAALRPRATPPPPAPPPAQARRTEAPPIPFPVKESTPDVSVTEDDLELVFLDGWDSHASFDEDVDSSDLSGELDIDIEVSWEEEAGDDEIVSVEEVLEKLGATRDRDAIIAQLLRPVIKGTTLVVLFRPRGKLAVALGASGTKLALEQVRQLMLPLSGDSLLVQAFEQRTKRCGDAANDPLQPMITNYLRTGETPGGACVVPLCIKDKVVNLIVVQANRLFSNEETMLFEKICDEAAGAYARLIARKKSS